MNVGIVANEFFDPSIGRMGGFGWAAHRAASLFEQNKTRGITSFFVGCQPHQKKTGLLKSRTIDIFLAGKNRKALGRYLEGQKPDLLLFIDFRKNYLPVTELLPEVPILVWMRDPRNRNDEQKLDGLRFPGDSRTKPPGLKSPDSSGLGKLVKESLATGRPVLPATPAPHLWDKLSEAYDWQFPKENLLFLPNPIEAPARGVAKSAEPLVLFLGRLDPYKRPWLFVELAKFFPGVRFIMLGKNHFEKDGWNPRGLPPNVELLGHIEGEEKKRLLAQAWILVNTSIHEGLAVSFLEALAAQTPLISCQDPGEVTSRYGIYVGRRDGDGTQSFPFFKNALGELLQDQKRRERLGAEGKAWVEATHTPERFLDAFESICRSIGLSGKT